MEWVYDQLIEISSKLNKQLNCPSAYLAQSDLPQDTKLWVFAWHFPKLLDLLFVQLTHATVGLLAVIGFGLHSLGDHA
jgi:hypothetical protein